MKIKRFTASLVVSSLITGCAVSPQQFAEKRQSLRPDELCRTREAAERKNNFSFLSEIDQELTRRGISPNECSDIVKKSNSNAAGAAVVILGALAIAAAAKSGGYGGNSYQPNTNTDYDWAWDQFYNSQYNLVWACRGIQTGQFAELYRCNYKAKNDNTWPSKRADGK